MPFNLLKRTLGVIINNVSSWVTSPKGTYRLCEPFFWLMGMRGKGREIELSKVKKVLVMRLDEIGDVVLFTPFLRELRRNLPDAWITLVVKPSVYNLVELCPYVNEVLTYDWNIQGRFAIERLHGRALKLAWKHLWRRKFDLAIVPRWDADHYHASFVAYLSGAPWRVGYSENVIEHKSQANKGYDRLFTHLLDDRTLMHEVERNLDLLRFIGFTVKDEQLELWVSREDRAFADEVFRDKKGGLIIGFGPSGGNSTLKQWPLSNFVELGRWLKTEYNANILIVGGPGEEGLRLELERELGSAAINMVGRTTLRQLASLLANCRFFIGNDTGSLHIAVAKNVPCIALLGPTCQHRFGPWGKGHIVIQSSMPCSPCSKPQHLDRCGTCLFESPKCIEGITVDQVKEAAAAQLKSR